MALTFTPDPLLGSPCPDFQLPNVDGRVLKRDDFKGNQALLVMFICNHCPYVLAVEERLLKLGRAYQGRGVELVAICSNDGVKYPEDSFAKMKERARDRSYPFPYLHDETQEVARAFGAVCTPDFFLYDGALKLAYRGRLDDSWKDASAVRSEELKAAIDALLAGQSPRPDQRPSMGCSIKWK